MEWPREIASFLSILPTLQGTRLSSNVPLFTLNEVIERIQQTLFPPNRHAPQMVLVFGLSAEERHKVRNQLRARLLTIQHPQRP